MKKLYRGFVVVSLSFLLLTFLLHFKSMFREEEEVRVRDGRVISSNEEPEDQNKLPGSGHVPIRKSAAENNHRQLPALWDANTIDDRIVQQMEFVPEIQTGSVKNIILSGSGDFDVPMGQDVFIRENCPVQNCKLFRELEAKGVKKDARIFNMYISHAELGLYPRDNDQVWILFALEGPLASPDYTLMGDVFNWTATYRRDSTIVAPYEKWAPFRNKSSVVTKNYAAGKTKKCAIFVSNCETTNDRMDYIRLLKKYIPVDIFGDCGDKECSRSEEKNCFDMLRKDYKFYLSFENSNCKDYITEKFFRNALMSDVLPIVMGAHPDEYARAAPPHSFIHVEDFKSPKELADYLHILDKNDSLYNEYFKWKGTGQFINTKFWCRVCALLNDPKMPTLTVKSLEQWWRPPRVCIRGDQRWRE